MPEHYNCMDENVPIYDAVIAGGGCAGASTALSLMQQGIQHIAIVEKNSFITPRIGETIQPPTAALLKQLGAWEIFLEEAHLPSYGSASAWGTSELGYNDFIYRAQGHGWHLDRNRFDQMMLRLAEQKGVRVFKQLQLTGAALHNDIWSLQCGKTVLRTHFVADATGRACTFARIQGSNKICLDDLHGIYSYWSAKDHPEELPGTTQSLVESVENGWWYTALLPNGQLAVAFMTGKPMIGEQRLRQREYYLANLQHAPHTLNRLQHYEMMTDPAVKAAGAYYSDKIAGDNWLAAGDSASAFDPLSSYGIHKALQAGIDAGVCIRSALDGDSAALKRYEQRIKKEFQGFLQTRFSYYQMETRWANHPFWRSRQKLTGIHPMQELRIKKQGAKHMRLRNRILPEKDMHRLIGICEQPVKAYEVVRRFQQDSGTEYPDWLVIHAVSYLQEMELFE